MNFLTPRLALRVEASLRDLSHASNGSLQPISSEDRAVLRSFHLQLVLTALDRLTAVCSHMVIPTAAPLEDSSTYTFTSSPDSASSSLGFEFDDSSSSSEDDIDSDVYTPSTSPSKISSTSPRTRQQTAREATTKPRAKQPLREQTMSEKLEGSEYAPLDFYIDLPARPVHSETGKGDPSIPQSSPQGVLSHQVSSNGTHH